MKPLIYRPGARFGNEPVDFSRCRAVSISAGRQCGQRGLYPVEGLLFCGQHRNLYVKSGGFEILGSHKFYHEREAENKPQRIGKDISHLIAPRRNGR